MTSTHLLVLETSGNQRYIYATNKVREIVGASELIHRAGTTWVDDALRGVTACEVLTKTSGKAIIAGEESSLREIIRQVTTRALVEAPGLDVAGAIVSVDDSGVGAAIPTAFGELERRRSSLRGPESRFLRIPLGAGCDSSTKPANLLVSAPGGGRRLASYEVAAKRAVADDGRRRLTQEPYGAYVSELDLLDETGLGGPWMALIHADGNGLGQVFLRLAKQVRNEGAAGEIQSYRELSEAVEECTRTAFAEAVRATAGKHPRLRVLPILLGGDDITVICSGSAGLTLACEYLTRFEDLSRSGKVEEILGHGLTAAASVVWTKTHFPYWASYAMAEAILAEAKFESRALSNDDRTPSSVDFHVMYDSSAASGDERPTHVTPDSTSQRTIRLRGGPYLTHDAPPGTLTVDELLHLRDVIAGSGGSGRHLSSNQVHDLRTRLTTSGLDVANARLGELIARHHEFAELSPEGDADLSFQQSTDRRAVPLLDAMDLADATGSSS